MESTQSLVLGLYWRTSPWYNLNCTEGGGEIPPPLTPETAFQSVRGLGQRFATGGTARWVKVSAHARIGRRSGASMRSHAASLFGAYTRPQRSHAPSNRAACCEVGALTRASLTRGEAAEDAFTAGNEEFVKENWRAALEHFSAAVELDGSKTEYHLHKAAALCKLGSYSDAVAVCDQVIGREGGNAKAYLRKGMALVGCGDLSAARGALEAGQALDASNRSFATWLKKCGDAPAPGTGSGGSAPGNVGKHDTELEGLLAAHGAQGYAVMETVVEFLARRTSVSSRAMCCAMCTWTENLPLCSCETCPHGHNTDEAQLHAHIHACAHRR